MWDDLIACKVAAKKEGFFIKHLFWGLIFSPAFACVFWYRVNRWLFLHNVPGYDLLHAWRVYRFGNDISYRADFGPGLRIKHIPGIVVAGRVTAGKNCYLRHGVTLGAKHAGKTPTLGDNVELGANVVVLGGVTIGDNAVIGALTFVDKDVEPNTIVYGIPPNQVRRRRDDSRLA